MTIQPAFGTKDLNPQEVQKNKLIGSKLSNLYRLWGYLEVSPPKIERLQTLMAGGSISANDIVKLVAEEPLGLRPEMTVSIARSSTTRFAHKERPLRLWSSGTVFKSKNDCNGKYKIEENINSGVELIGYSGMESEVELLYLLLESHNALSINNIDESILLIGHSNLSKILTEDFDSDKKEKIQKYLANYDLINIENTDIKDITKKQIKKILNKRGNPFDVLETMESTYGKRKIFEELKRLFAIIVPIGEKHGISIQLDPTYQSHFDIYTGLIFELVCKTKYNPITIARGGRYDNLFNIFGKDKAMESGAGFSFSIDRINELIRGDEFNDSNEDKVLVAYSKKKSYEEALEKQIEIHKTGKIAMVEFIPCESKEEAYKVSQRRGFNKLEWIN